MARSYNEWRTGSFGDFVTESEVDTVSGTLQDGIDSNTAVRHNRTHVMTSQSDHTSGNWKIFASNGSGDVTEITHGSDNQILTSNGATSAPTWQDSTVSATGDGVDYGTVLTTNGTYKGSIMTVTVDDAAVVFGNPLYCASDFHYDRCSASSTSTMYCVGLALEGGSGAKKMLLEGQICNTGWNWTSDAVYISLVASVGLTQTAVSGTGEQLQRVGFALSSDTIYFMPDSTIVGT